MTPDNDMKRLSETELRRLREAGVSAEFMAVVQTDPEEVGRSRNSARERARQMLRTTPDDTHPEDLPLDRYTGDYARALREGNLGEAFIKADIANTRILVALFGREYLTERIAAEDGDYEYAKRYVDQNIETHAADLV